MQLVGAACLPPPPSIFLIENIRQEVLERHTESIWRKRDRTDRHGTAIHSTEEKC